MVRRAIRLVFLSTIAFAIRSTLGSNAADTTCSTTSDLVGSPTAAPPFQYDAFRGVDVCFASYRAGILEKSPTRPSAIVGWVMIASRRPV
jgi:hypothetical protein